MENMLYELLSLLVTLAMAGVVELLRRKIGAERLNKIAWELEQKKELARLAVLFVEQAYKDLHGEEKYGQSAKWLSERAGEIGIKITPDEVKGLIESAVKQFKEEWSKPITA